MKKILFLCSCFVALAISTCVAKPPTDVKMYPAQEQCITIQLPAVAPALAVIDYDFQYAFPMPESCPVTQINALPNFTVESVEKPPVLNK